ncbi:MAG: FecCD family ABC transporter permease [Beutenbergiaceae bacterium]
MSSGRDTVHERTVDIAVRHAEGDTASAITAAADGSSRQRSLWRGERRVARRKVYALILVLVAIFIVSFNLGRYDGISMSEIIQILISRVFPLQETWSAEHEKVILYIRFPRISSAVLVGAALALAGAAYQTVFKNPLVSPDILGASSGASLGAAAAIFLGMRSPYIQLSAFVLALLAVWATVFVGEHVKRDPILALVLSGVFISSLANALVSLLKFMADPEDRLPTITYWLMGSLSNIGLDEIGWAAIPMLLSAIPLLLLRWRLNVLSLGEDEAKSLGVETRRLRALVIVCATLLTASAISIGGLIGWVGLVIPHLIRMLVGPNNSYMLPATALAGGGFLLLVDNLARALTTTEIPLGVLTAIIGAPFFIALIMRESVKR